MGAGSCLFTERTAQLLHASRDSCTPPAQRAQFGNWPTPTTLRGGLHSTAATCRHFNRQTFEFRLNTKFRYLYACLRGFGQAGNLHPSRLTVRVRSRQCGHTKCSSRSRGWCFRLPTDRRLAQYLIRSSRKCDEARDIPSVRAACPLAPPALRAGHCSPNAHVVERQVLPLNVLYRASAGRIVGYALQHLVGKMPLVMRCLSLLLSGPYRRRRRQVLAP